jgi:hypothetical protein
MFLDLLHISDRTDFVCDFEDGATESIYSSNCKFNFVTSDDESESWVKVQGLDNTYGTKGIMFVIFLDI